MKKLTPDQTTRKSTGKASTLAGDRELSRIGACLTRIHASRIHTLYPFLSKPINLKQFVQLRTRFNLFSCAVGINYNINKI